MKKTTKNPTPLETDEQIAYVAWFRRTFPGVLIHSIPNGLYIGHRQREKAIAEGMIAGPSDLHVPLWQLYIEMKRTKGGRQSTEQAAYSVQVANGGGTYLLCKGCENAISATLEFLKNNPQLTR